MFILSAFLLRAQIIGKSELTKTIILTDSSINRRLYLPITKGMAYIHFFFKVNVSDGGVTVNIEDPEGKQEGGFRVTADTEMEENGEKGSKGQMTHEVNFPIQGNWLILLKSKHASGTLSYEIKLN